MREGADEVFRAVGIVVGGGRGRDGQVEGRAALGELQHAAVVGASEHEDRGLAVAARASGRERLASVPELQNRSSWRDGKRAHIRRGRSAS